ncbi:perakine reductase [Amborella trichopoda]|uniref:perakine reductase n=1 Tax=Amborella trichopoda TaxID=13333 RepID=UPI0009BEBAFA|nr:perakine reductase [Amborella trichopoda]|eukprot:XP_011621633.2 perakine reductase [Amborella trichopoda]
MERTYHNRELFITPSLLLRLICTLPTIFLCLFFMLPSTIKHQEYSMLSLVQTLSLSGLRGLPLCLHSPKLRACRNEFYFSRSFGAKMASEIMPRIKLGSQGLEVSKLGYGCMGLTGRYNAPVPEEDGIAIMKYVFDKGITFFDTSDVYGPNHMNEILVGKALKHLPRDKVQLGTKFGILKITETELVANGTPEYVRQCCEASLKRLDVDYIDLYYQHRVDTSVPIEDTIGELKKLVEEGKVKYIGLSEASMDTIRRAHAVHPITAVQLEWSLWSRDSEDWIIPICRELGIGIVPYSPLGRGFFAGKAVVESLSKENDLVAHPRFKGENFEKNKSIYIRITNLAGKYGCTPAQLALAWVLYQGDDVAPIPGTTKIKNLDENLESLKLRLTVDDIKQITDSVPLDEVAGSRAETNMYNSIWKFTDTPPKR